MPPSQLRLTLPPTPAALAAIALAFVLPGLAGHDPWKSHDALGIGIAWEMASRGDPIVPRIAGMAFVADPPLYHWIAVAFGKIFGLFMEFHAAARLASGAFMLGALWLIHVASRDLSLGEERTAATGAGAVLLLLGSVGLMVHAHEALPELAALAALCGGLAVLPHATRKPVPAGIVFGAALGFGLLSATWIAPVALGIAVLLALPVCPEWRNRRALPFLGLAAATFALIAASWPAALAWREPQVFSAWWAAVTQRYETPAQNLRYFVSTLSWFAWPAWPLALWAGWSLRRRWADPRVFVPALASVLMLAGLVYWGPALDVNLIPLLAPLCLLASQGIPTLRRGAAAALDWFSVITFAFFAGLVWLGYVAMMTGTPPKVAANFARAAPGFVPQFELAPFVVALVLTLGWLYVVFFTSPSVMRSVARWAAGIVLLWGTFAMLWMPWADYQKTYRAVAQGLRAKIPSDYAGCITARNLGVPQAAALDYHAGIRTRPFDVRNPRACQLMLVQGHPSHEADAPGPGWSKLADEGRPGDRAERQRLYRLVK